MLARGMAAMVAARAAPYALPRVRVAVLVNERSGRGRVGRLGASVADALSRAGHEVAVVAVGPGTRGHDAANAIDGSSLAVVVGGDGTVNHLLDALSSRAVPLYHLPTGNENLFAREFGMSAGLPRFLAAVERNRVVRVDFARCNGRPFALMASVGPDAGVIHRLDAMRTRAVGHAAYVRPVFEELMRPRLARLTVTVDGEPIVEARRGLVVVANSRHYGLRIDPCPMADIADGLLDTVFFPASTAAGALAWMLAARCRAQFRFPSCRFASGRRIELSADDADAPCQIDGETGPAGIRSEPSGRVEWRCAVEPRALSILAPR